MGKNSVYNRNINYKSEYYLINNMEEKFDKNDWNNNNTVILDDSIYYDDSLNNSNISIKKKIQKYKKY